ncbi:MAG: hypothetical protein IMZ71_01560 [Chloroflexi bacterium]|nr:hypothetical protein [Chloroflexota bacterium]
MSEHDDIQSRAMVVAQQASAFEVKTADDYERGVESMRRIKTMRRQWDDLQRPAIKAAKASHDVAVKTFRSIDDQLERAFNGIKALCEEWMKGRLEDQRRQLAAARATVPVQNLEREFEEAREGGDVAKASRILDQVDNGTVVPMPAMAPPPSATVFVPKMEGVSTATNWTYDIVDEALIPRTFMMPDKQKIKKVVQALKGDTHIAGIEARPDTGLRVREH